MCVCHSNSLFTPPLNLRHNDASIDSGCSTYTWPLTAPVHNFQKTSSSVAINVKLTNDQLNPLENAPNPFHTETRKGGVSDSTVHPQDIKSMQIHGQELSSLWQKLDLTTS